MTVSTKLKGGIYKYDIFLLCTTLKMFSAKNRKRQRSSSIKSMSEERKDLRLTKYSSNSFILPNSNISENHNTI